MLPPRLPGTDLTAQYVNGVLTVLVETRAVEYKQSAAFNDLRPHIVKTAMAMANLASGGHIIVGVLRHPSGLQRTGVASAELATYDPDDVLSEINKYASPAINALVAIVEHNGKDYIVIAVSEFGVTPVVCSRNGEWSHDQRIFAGAIYIRPEGFVETRTPKKAEELGELLDHAALKRAIKMVRTRELLNLAELQGAGSPRSLDQRLAATSTADQYNKELGGAADL